MPDTPSNVDPIQAAMEKMQAENRQYLAVRALHAQYGPQLHEALSDLITSLAGRDTKGFSRTTARALEYSVDLLEQIATYERGLKEQRG